MIRSVSRWAHCAAFLLGMPLTGTAQHGWISATAGWQQASYITPKHTEGIAPGFELEVGLRYRHDVGKWTGIFFGWRYGQRSYTLVRQEQINSGIRTPLRTEFEVIENAPMLGICLRLHRRPHWEWHLLVAAEGRFAHSTRIHWTIKNNSSTTQGTSDLELPAHLALRLGLRCTGKPSSRISVFLEPHLLLVKPSNFAYVPMPGHSTLNIYIGEGRITGGVDLGVEFGPLFKRRPSEAPAE